MRLIGHFWALWASRACSNLADGVVKLVLPLVAINFTREPVLIAGVAFALTLPWLMVSLPIGVLVDHWDRRRAVQRGNLLRVVVLVALIVLDGTHLLTLPFVYIAALGLGIAEVLVDTASGALVPAVVPPAQLERANARLTAVETLTNQFVGPPLGGLLIAISTGLAAGVSAVCYVLALAALLPLNCLVLPSRSVPQRLVRASLEGIQFIWQQRTLRLLTVMLAVMNLCWSAFSAVLVLYAVAPGPVGLTPTEYGVLLTGIGIGSVLGSFLVAPSQRLLGRHRLIAADVLGTGVMLLIPALTANRWAIGAAAILAGIGGTISNVVLVAFRQRMVPDALLGRVSGALRMVSYGALSVGAALGGVVAQITDVRVVFLAGALLSAGLLIPIWRGITPAVLDEGL